VNKTLFLLDMKCLKKTIIVGSSILSLIIIAIWLFVYFTSKDVSADTFHVDYQYILVKVLSPIAIFMSVYIGRYVYSKYHSFQINESIYTTELSKRVHFITHILSAVFAVAIVNTMTTFTIISISLLFNAFTLRLLLIQLCFLIGLLSAVFIGQMLIVVMKTSGSSTWILSIPLVTYVYNTISEIVKGLDSRIIVILNRIFKYIDFLSFFSIDLQATSISRMATINFFHMMILFVVSTILLMSSFTIFRRKELI